MRIYVSHAIRGALPLAPGETLEDRCATNNRIASLFGAELRGYWPNVDWYIPGEQDVFPMMAYRQGLLTIDQILDIDCEIIRECAALFPVRWETEPSEGMIREWKFAKNHHIHILTTDRTSPKHTLTVQPKPKDGKFLWVEDRLILGTQLDTLFMWGQGHAVMPAHLRVNPFPVS